MPIRTIAAILAALCLTGACAAPASASAPAPALTAAQQGYLALAREGVAQAERHWQDRRRRWYDARLGDGDRYPLATIWDIVPLFESLDASRSPSRARPTGARWRASRRARSAT